MDCPNCSASFRLRSQYAAHLRGCMPRMIVDVSRGYLVTDIHGIRQGDMQLRLHATTAHPRRKEAPLAQ